MVLNLSFLQILSIALSIPQFILFFITLNYSYEFSKYRNHHVFIKRRAWTTILTSFCWTFTGLFGALYVLCIAKIIPISYEPYITFCYSSITPAATLALRARIWLVYYDVNWKLATDQQQWKDLINPKASENNWFIKNKYRWGNAKKIYHFSIIFYLIEVMPFSMIYLLFDLPTTLVGAGLVFVHIIFSWVFITYFYCKTPDFDDIFYIRPEIQSWLFIVGVFTASFFLGNAVLFFLPVQTQSYIWMCIYTLWSFLFSCGTYYSSKYVLNKLLHIIRKCTLNESTPKLNLSLQIAHSNSVHRRDNKETDTEHTMNKLLSNQKGYDLFMQHLGNEFSRECLLSYTEFTQYQEFIYNILQAKGIELDESLTYSYNQCLTFPCDIPKSYIIYGDNDNIDYKNKNDRECREIAYNLWEKYIVIGSSLQINISSREINIFDDLMGNVNSWLNNEEYNIKKLFYLFAKPKNEMYWLLNHSFWRFEKSDEGALAIEKYRRSTVDQNV